MRLPFFFLALFLLAACDLEDVQPLDEQPIDEAFDSVEDLKAAIVGVYDHLQSPDLAGQNLLYFSDILGGNTQATVDDFVEIANLAMEADNQFVTAFWSRSYRALNQLNLILDYTESTAAEDPTINLLAGEAHFLRGLLYFELVRLFALPYGPNAASDPGVPLVLTPVRSIEALNFPARASVAAVYQQVEADFSRAYELLPEDNPAGRGRVDRPAGLAYLARMAFQQGDDEAATLYSDELLNLGRFQLNANPAFFFTNEGSPEEIWTVISTVEDANFNSLTTLYQPIFTPSEIHPDLVGNGYEQIVPPAQLAAIEDSLPGAQVADLRCYAGDFSDPLISPDTLLTKKYEDAVTLADDAPMARLAEFLLMRAELHVRAGEKEAAVALLNQIRGRSLRLVDEQGFLIPNGEQFFLFKADDFPTEGALLDAIRRERRVELAFEGNYFHDLMRRRADVQGLPFDADELRFPIPQREMDVNPNLVQNPGYE